MQFRNRPKDGVISSSPDGLYLFELPNKNIQIISIGPLLFTPGEIEEQVQNMYPDNGYLLVALDVLSGITANSAEVVKHIVMRRGFLSLQFQHKANG